MSREIWVISDTHFNHSNILNFTDENGKYIREGFKTAEQMNEFMTERWNSVVKPGDKVYHLGDVYMGGGFPREYTEKLLSNLNGRKRLILGNHDNGKDQILQRAFQKIDVWRMFTEFGLLLTHVPVHPSTLKEGRFSGHGKPQLKMLNVHGHIHANPSPEGPYKCVCVEQIDYTPVNIEELRVV